MKRIILSLVALTLIGLNLNAQNMNKKALVVYFSVTGNTATVANNLADAIGADIFEIEPMQLYTSDDLDWTDENSRSSVEMKDSKARPEMNNNLDDAKEYDLIYLGFPIWWYTAPRIINTFLEKTDMAGKTIVLFATSGGSGMENTVESLKPSAPKATFKRGKVLSKDASQEELKEFAKAALK